jgi:hypothetical protein
VCIESCWKWGWGEGRSKGEEWKGLNRPK